MKVVDVYKITYSDYGVSQHKNLISHDDYVNEVKPMLAEIARLEGILPRSKSNMKKVKELKSYIKEQYGDEYFTNNSPIWNSQFNNSICKLPKSQGGDCKIILEKVEYYFISNLDNLIHSTSCINCKISKDKKSVAILGGKNENNEYLVEDECNLYKSLDELINSINKNSCIKLQYFTLSNKLRSNLIKLGYEEIKTDNDISESVILMDYVNKSFTYGNAEELINLNKLTHRWEN